MFGCILGTIYEIKYKKMQIPLPRKEVLKWGKFPQSIKDIKRRKMNLLRRLGAGVRGVVFVSCLYFLFFFCLYLGLFFDLVHHFFYFYPPVLAPHFSLLTTSLSDRHNRLNRIFTVYYYPIYVFIGEVRVFELVPAVRQAHGGTCAWAHLSTICAQFVCQRGMGFFNDAYKEVVSVEYKR